MEFQIKILLISFVATVLLGLVIIPILQKLKVGQNERDDGPESHLKKQGTPTMGGIIMLISVIISTFCGYLYYTNIKNEPDIARNLIPFLILSLGFGFIGFLDDFIKLILKNTKGLSPKLKMLGLLVISVFYTIYQMSYNSLGTETFIPFIKTYITLPVYIYIPFIILVMLATTNAINLTDGVDGLAGCVSVVIVTTLVAISILLGLKEVTIFGSIICGAIIGFLLFNLNKAKVFMGDTGSLFLGGIIAGMAIYLKMPLILLIIALVPVCETLSVMLQVAYFKKTGKRIFKMAPLHHHFELCGWKENKVVLIFSSVTLLLCILGIFSI